MGIVFGLLFENRWINSIHIVKAEGAEDSVFIFRLHVIELAQGAEILCREGFLVSAFYALYQYTFFCSLGHWSDPPMDCKYLRISWWTRIYITGYPCWMYHIQKFEDVVCVVFPSAAALFYVCPWNVSSQCSSAHRCARANIFLIMKTIACPTKIGDRFR